MRNLFNKHGGNLATTGSVAFQFKRMGVFRLNPEGIDADDLELYLIDHGLEELTVIGPDGRILARQPKCFPTQGEIDNGVIAGHRYQIVETDIGRLGIVICADFAFFSEGADALVEQGMQYGKPVIGVDIAACSLRLQDADGRLVERFPRAGGYSTVCVPPPIASLAELAEWFRAKPGGTNSAQGFIQSLGEDEGILYADVDIAAVRRFPGYFYRSTNP